MAESEREWIRRRCEKVLKNRMLTVPNLRYSNGDTILHGLLKLQDALSEPQVRPDRKVLNSPPIDIVNRLGSLSISLLFLGLTPFVI